MFKSFKFRLCPNANQERELGIMLETHRRLYNFALRQRQWFYDEWGITRSCFDQYNWFTEERKTNAWFGRLSVSSARGTLRRLDQAFSNFFRRIKNDAKPGYPRFKSVDRFDSILYSQNNAGISLNGNRLRVQYVGSIRVRLHREVQGAIKTVSLKREAGKWFVILTTELEKLCNTDNILPAVGLDVGITHFLTTSNGYMLDNPRYLKAELPLLRRIQRSVSRKKKGGNNRKKASSREAKIHARVANLRREHQHKISNYLLSLYGKIAVERLNVHGMLKNGRLSRAISDVAWSSFIAVLTYKAERAGSEVVQVSPNNTSQLCSCCGAKVPKTLVVRIHECPECGLVLDRDENAARNILERAWPGTGQWSETWPARASVLQEA